LETIFGSFWRRDIGIRVALGALASDVQQLVPRHVLKVVFVAVIVLPTVVALLAAYVPAHRAAKLDPIATLR